MRLENRFQSIYFCFIVTFISIIYPNMPTHKHSWAILGTLIVLFCTIIAPALPPQIYSFLDKKISYPEEWTNIIFYYSILAVSFYINIILF